ncbi:DNA polymerase Y family protein [Simiduia sp. 21SJ11W-1]|uniref:Y-family DNA polymerase n=1 Tax=Simiduia sp. 21SJ11W-1 TaxID=2909669 RepID=UPI00209FD4C0|nr:DNA polymerase Y family protein [Simiduia sp. 21SJ11W-1]UTA46428.1 DNA polymerase Y family protein [Simiduia sp. 21SJ11W-1]
MSGARQGAWADTGQRWLCLYFPALAIDHWQRQQVEARPLGLYQGSQLVMCNGAAQLAGVEAGMSLASAQALIPSIVLRPHEPEHADALLRALAQWAYGFTSAVIPEPPRRLMLELAASVRLFGGLHALLGRIARELHAWGCDAAVGLAPTAAGARLLALANFHARSPGGLSPAAPGAAAGPSKLEARAKPQGAMSLSAQLQALESGQWQQAVAAQPLAYLPLPKASLQRLNRAGFQTLGQLLAVPKASIGRRFDQPLVQLLRKLQGLAPELAPHFNEPPEFNRNQVFMYGLTEVAHLHTPVNALLAELKQFLRQRQLVCKQICWRFVHVDRTCSELPVSVQRAHADVGEFLALTTLKLEQFTLAAPVEVVGLQVPELTAEQAPAAGLFPELCDGAEQANRLLDRLYQRLSHTQLVGFELCDEHLPELQQRAVRAGTRRLAKPKARPAVATELPGSGAALAAPQCMLSPWLYHEPQPLLLRAGRLMWQGEPLVLASLAERIDSHWWAQRQRRDYFVARKGCGYVRVFFCHQRQAWFGAGVYVC